MNKRINLSGIDIAYWLTVAAILIASLFPHERLWGLNWYGYFPWPWRLLTLAAAAGCWYSVRRLSAGGLQETAGSTTRFLATASVIAAALTGLFVLLSVKTHFLGDGYLLMTRVYEGVGRLRIWHTGPYAILNAVYFLVGDKSEAGARLTFQLISYVSGLLFLMIVVLAAVRLFAANRHRLLFLLGMASGGHMLVYFGYVENYPPFVTVVTAFCVVGTLIAIGRINRWWIVPLWLVAATLHVFASSLFPAMVYVLVAGTSLERRISALSRAVKVGLSLAVAIICVALFAYAYNRSYFFRFAWTPFLPNRFTVEGYHLFSGKHVLDYLNELLVLCPSMAVLAVAIGYSGLRDAFRRAELRFLTLASAGALLLMLLVYPRLGMPRDWDLFAFLAVPALMFGYYIILGGGAIRIPQPVAAILSITLCCLVFTPRLATQLDTETSIAVFDSYAGLDKARSNSGRFVLLQFMKKHGRMAEGERRAEQSRQELPHEYWVLQGIEAERQGDSVKATSLFRMAREADPQNAHAWLNYGVMLLRKGQTDSARICVEIADGLNPDNCFILTNLGTTYYYCGRREDAETCWLRACELDADDFSPRASLLRFYTAENRHSDFSVLMAQCGARTGGPVTYDRSLADFLMECSEYELAAQIYKRALSKGLDSSYVRDVQRRYPDLHVID